MLPDFISITNLQRELKKVFSSRMPVRVVLSRNEVSGLVFSKDAAQKILSSGVLDQIREELWELNDPETIRVVRESRNGKGRHSIPFDTWMKKQKV